jgi:hypothetical protein
MTFIIFSSRAPEKRGRESKHSFDNKTAAKCKTDYVRESVEYRQVGVSDAHKTTKQKQRIGFTKRQHHTTHLRVASISMAEQDSP